MAGPFRSKRNRGYGKHIEFACKNVIRERYCGGHFASTQTHVARLRPFLRFLKQVDIADLGDIRSTHIEEYALEVGTWVEEEVISVAFAQNLLSSVNVLAASLWTVDRPIVSPSRYCGSRSQVRTIPPTGLDPHEVQRAIAALRHAGLLRAAAILGLCRHVGTRLREAVLMDRVRTAREAGQLGRIDIRDGCKGGRTAPRWITLDDAGRVALRDSRAAHPMSHPNLLAPDESLIECLAGEVRQARQLMRQSGLRSYRDLRSAFACARYRDITGHDAPVVSGYRVPRHLDEAARRAIAEMLGHGRVDVTNSYLGASR